MKSDMVELWLTLLSEVSARYSIDASRDVETVRARLDEEGFSFLTITVPEFDSTLMELLRTSHYPSRLTDYQESDLFHPWYSYPVLFSGFFELIEWDLRLCLAGHWQPRIVPLIRDFRTLLNLFKKINLPCSDERVSAALQQYVDTDSAIPRVYPAVPLSNDIYAFLRDVDESLDSWVGNHGPGAVTPSVLQNQKFEDVTWSERLSHFIPPWDAYHFRYDPEVYARQEVLAWDQEHPVRVITVPKTLKTPRIIAVEPIYRQYAQQGIWRIMDSVLHRRKHSRLASKISWRDQSRNRDLARLGSKGQVDISTLDLSEASDRVALSHIKTLLRPFPRLLNAVLACRGEFADVPEHGIIPLNKYASMGSSLTFPLETLVFYAIVESVVKSESSSATVSVYGDDIIVPTIHDRSVRHLLQSYGLKVNETKSFVSGPFRESCGFDGLFGFNVAPTYLRRTLPTNIHHAAEFESLVAFHNLMEDYPSTRGWVRDYVSRIGLPILWGPVGTPSLVFTGDGEPIRKVRNWLHYTKSYIIRRKTPLCQIDGDAALRKFLVPHDVRHEDHLLRDGRPQPVRVTVGWALGN